MVRNNVKETQPMLQNVGVPLFSNILANSVELMVGRFKLNMQVKFGNCAFGVHSQIKYAPANLDTILQKREPK